MTHMDRNDVMDKIMALPETSIKSEQDGRPLIDKLKVLKYLWLMEKPRKIEGIFIVPDLSNVTNLLLMFDEHSRKQWVRDLLKSVHIEVNDL